MAAQPQGQVSLLFSDIEGSKLLLQAFAPFTVRTTLPARLQVLSERMMGLEPTTFCMAKASGRAGEAVIEKTAPHLTRPSSLPGCPVRFRLRDHAR
jgi:hypothetical protein